MKKFFLLAAFFFFTRLLTGQISQGTNWLQGADFESSSGKSLPAGFSFSDLQVSITEKAHSGKYALQIVPLKDQAWLRFPIQIPGGKIRRFVFTFWAKTEFDTETGDAVSFYLHMSTPGFVGAGSGFPRTRFKYLKDWVHIGGIITTDVNPVGWFRFIFYTTRAGLSVYLDDLFFTEVTDLPAETVKKFLEGTTLNPEMNLVALAGEKTDYQPGNKLLNSSFELPGNCGWAYFGGGRLNRAGGGSHGQYCLKADRLYGQRVSLRPYRRHTFSACFRAGSRKTVRVELLNCYAESYRTAQAAISQTFTVEENWKRYQFSFVPAPNPSGNAYALRFSGDVFVDEVCLEEGTDSGYSPAAPSEYSLHTEKPFHLFQSGEKISLFLCGFNYTSQTREEKIKLALVDYRDELVYSQAKQLQLPPGFFQEKIELPDYCKGAFRVQVQNDKGKVIAEQVISVIPQCFSSGLRPESKFGALVHLTEENLQVAQKLGIKWSRDHWSFCWYRLEPEPGKWNFQEAEEKVHRAARYGVSVFGVLHGVPSWASIDGSQSYTSRPKDWKKWEEYVEKTVGHFRDKVKVWEIWNEPQSAEFYTQLCQHTYQAAKRANPDCLLIGLSSTLFSGDFLKEFVERGGLNYLDEVSSHIYNYNPGLEEAFLKYSQKLGGKPVWNTEGGGWGGSTFYTSRLDYRPGRPGVQQVAKYYTTVMSLPFVRFHCYYWNIWPADYTPSFEYSWTFFEYDSSVKPEGVAYAVTAATLEGSQPVRILAKGNLKIHVFQRGKKTILAGWNDGEGILSVCFHLPGNYVSRDIMGNEKSFQAQGKMTWNLEKDVSFLEADGLKVEEVLKALEESLNNIQVKPVQQQERNPVEIEKL